MKKEAKKILEIGLAITVVVIAAFFAMNANANGYPNEVWVDDDFDSSTPGWGYDHFDTIQKGVDNVSAGGIVHVWNGEYYENITITKTVTIIGNTTVDALNGICNSKTNLSCDEFGFRIEADWVNISGFTILWDDGGEAGIFINNSDHCNISNSNISWNNVGIWLNNSDYNTIYNNIFYENIYGIMLNNSGHNIIEKNNIINSDDSGIYYGPGKTPKSWNEIKYNNISYNYYGIYLLETDNETIYGNEMWYNDWEGIYLESCEDIIVTDNNISGSTYGIDGYWVNHSQITYNNISSNDGGIRVWLSRNITISNNNISYNDDYGIEINGSIFNKILNNTLYFNGYGINIIKMVEYEDESTFDGEYWHEWHNVSALNIPAFNTIYNNTISNSKYGIYIDSGIFTIITNNTVYNNGDGIYLVKNIVEEYYEMYNDTYDYSYTSVYFVYTPNYNTIINNTVYNNDDYGIYIDAGDFNTIDNNTIYNNTNGIYLAKNVVYEYYEYEEEDDNWWWYYYEYVYNVYTPDNNIISNNTIYNNGYMEEYLPDIQPLEDEDGYGYGIYIDAGDNNTIFNNTIYNNTNGIYLDKNVVHEYDWWEEYLYGVYTPDNNTILNNTIYNHPRYVEDGIDGIEAMADGYNYGYGIYIDAGDNNTIFNNTIYNNTNGIYLDKNVVHEYDWWEEYLYGVYTPDNNTILNNTIYNHPRYVDGFDGIKTMADGDGNGFGIYIDAGDNNTIINNTIYNNTNGIYLDKNVVYEEWMDGISSDTQPTKDGDGWIHVYTPDNNIIANNTIYNNHYVDYFFPDIQPLPDGDNYGYGIYIDAGDNNTIINNTIYNNTNGIYLDKNVVYDDWGDIYGVYTSDNNTIANNTIYNNFPMILLLGDIQPSPGMFGGFGIYIDAGDNNTIFNNTIYNSTYGIYLAKNTVIDWDSWIFYNFTSDWNEILNNALYDNYLGIYLDCSKNNTIENNMISDIIWDLYVYNATNNTFVNNTFSSYPTTASFVYNGSFAVRGVSNPPSDPKNYSNIGKYLNITNLTANTWVFVYIYYEDADTINHAYESTLKIWKYNGTWYEEGWNGSRLLDTNKNIVGVNITDFGSIFAPLGLEAVPPISKVNTISPYCQDLPVIITATAIDLPVDTGSGVSNVTLYYRYSTHNKDWSPWMEYARDETEPWQWAFNPTNGSGYYQFYSIAIDNHGNVEQKSPLMEAWLCVPYNYTFHLVKGWNLITLPVKNSISKASELASLIGSNCTVIVKWDSEKQRYIDYVVGITSTNNIDFDIEDGIAYFVGMKGNENVSIKGCLFDSMDVPLHTGYNLIGWVNMEATNSSSIEQSMAAIDSLWDWNETMQKFIGFPINLFNITIADGFFVHVVNEATWHGI